ncbi:MAG: hypothetical protein WAQ98_00945 [Blastocatellia bacterium]
MNLSKISNLKFKELTKSTRNRSGLLVDATYTINSKGDARLRFTKQGMAKLDKIFGEDKSKPFKLFIDEETQSLAFLLTETGTYKLTGWLPDRNLLTYYNLSKVFTKEKLYMIVESENYSFLLLPTDLLDEPETQPLTIETKKVEEPPKLTDNASPAKKPKGKKK